MDKINFNSYHPILDIQDHVVFANNGNVVLCYKSLLHEVYSLSDSNFDELHDIWRQSLKTLPVGSIVHKQEIYQNKKLAK